ncbi:MAG: thiamine phosphate synthase [Limisphaerales bacterium]|jgi:thiamine-phosphate pyrophosphorylase|nr:thiamine phosphate synthase [Verrucomicrobiota bacterium]
MKRIEDCRLYTFIDGAYLNGRKPTDIAKALIDGGSDIIQLRMKDAGLEETLEIAKAVIKITRAASIPLVINDHPQVAAAVGAEYLHLGQEDFFDAGYRKVSEVLQPLKSAAFQVGLSSHAPEEALKAEAAGAVYLGVGPVYATGTKPQARPVTLEYVRWAATHLQLPWFAIGGVKLWNLPELMEAGARRICVVSDILNAKDIASQCQRYRALLEEA